METKFTFIDTPYASSASNREKAYKRAYKAWCQDKIKNHSFTVSIKDIMAKLHVSSYWIKTRLFPAVEYIKVAPNVLEELGMDPKSRLLFNENQLRVFLKHAATFSRQTIVIDLLKLKEAKKIALAIENDPAIAKWDEDNKHVYGKRSNRILTILGDDFDNVQETKRSMYEHVSLAPFDFWNRKLVIPVEYVNYETAYRDIFRKGMVKISIFGKTVFTQLEDLKCIAYPLTIQYTSKDK